MLRIIPFFPNNPKLENHWWHRLMKVVSTFIVVVSGIFVVVSLVLLCINAYAIVAGPGLIFKITDTTTNKQYGVKASEYAQIVKELYPAYKDLDDSTLVEKLKNKNGENVVNEEDLKRVVMEKGHTPANSLVPFGIFKTDAEANIQVYLLILVISVIVLFIPTVFYRLILYIFTGKF